MKRNIAFNGGAAEQKVTPSVGDARLVCLQVPRPGGRGGLPGAGRAVQGAQHGARAHLHAAGCASQHRTGRAGKALGRGMARLTC